MADEEVTPPEAPAATDKSTEKEPDVFSRDYVETLRKESATYRTRAKQFEDPFSAFDAEQQEAWLDLISNFAKDPKAAAAEMQAVAAEILKEQEDSGVEKGDPDYVSKKEVEKLLQAQMTQLEVAREKAAVEAQAITLGYTPNSKDLETRLEYEALVKIALELPGYDLVEADKQLKALNQKKIDAWLEKKKQDAKGTPKAPVAGGSAPSQETDKKPTSFDDLEDRVLARIKAQNFDQ